MPDYLLVLGASAALCALVARLLGGPLCRSIDDPALTERVQRHRHLLALAVALASLTAVVTTAALEDRGLELLPASRGIPFLLLCVLTTSAGAMIGNLPTRRVLFGETATTAEYVGQTLRGTAGFAGFWIALAMAPFAVDAAGAWRGPVAVALAAALWAWSRHFAGLALAIVRAEPLDRPDLRARLDEVVAKADVPTPDIMVYGVENGASNGAFALPHDERPTVLLGRGLLKRLEPDEVAAVFAHEVGHLEDFAGELLARFRRADLLMIAAGCAGVPLLGLVHRDLVHVFLWAWFAAVWVFLAVRARGMQAHETASDQRAVELCGDAGAVERALVKLHDGNHIPRRQAARVEQSASHPSLARRLQQVRDHAASLADPQPSPDAASTAPDQSWAACFLERHKKDEVLVLDADRVSWLTLPAGAGLAPEPAAALSTCEVRERAEAERSVTYPGLVELRVVARQRGAELRAVERSGHVTRFALRDEDLAELQRCLDRVDGRLAPAVALARPVIQGSAALGVIGALSSFLLSQQGTLPITCCLALLVVALVAALTRRRPWIAGLGAMLVAAAVVTVAAPGDKSWWSDGAWLWLAVTGALGALTMGAVLSQGARDEEQRQQRRSGPAPGLILAVTGAVLVAAQLAAMGSGEPLLVLHGWGRELKGSVLLLVGAAAALALPPRRWARTTASALATAAVVHVAAGSDWFLEHVARDPLAAITAPPELTERAYEPLRTALVESGYGYLALSPDGTHFAVTADALPGQTMARFVIGDFAGDRVHLNAIALAFVDGHRLLALVHNTGGGGVELRELSPADPETVRWKLALPELDPATGVDLAAYGERWRVVAGRAEAVTHRVQGIVGSGDVERTRWSREPGGERSAGDGPRLLETAPGGVPRGAPGSGQRVCWLLQGYYRPVTLRLLGARKIEPLVTTACWVDVREPPPGTARAVLSAFGPGRGHVWSLDLDSGALEPLFSLDVHRALQWDGRRVAVLQRGALLVVDAKTTRGVRLPLPRPAGWSVGLAMAGERIALSWPHPERPGVRRIELLELGGP